MYKLSPKEIEVMVNKSAKDRYIYFVKRVADQEAAWILKDKEGFVTTSDTEASLALPIWPFKEYASKLKENEWKDLELKKISFKQLSKEILPNLSKDSVNVAVFMVPNTNEVVTVSADRLLDDLLNEQSKFL
ncbi:DUF2750 domain-containing protein [Listeria swaminathanii]|uniref:DUF2750 domain-containing protein n=1 Tax=Listeria swaminathanii TaxID=2713501 RepID=A0ABU2IC07_9LIST|nr:DUF2750 domain-containing protein [Listeria swaminathanii]MDT0016507.1 DUF2750 domain-containing protein [Listeria swaminathanii]MDT0021943.1 DUF2750 domain-containing protein [Listeria swaminathanii]MDT0032907.1 DUF2750 domain-containing protein [Listeria swaminathanii]MDT0051243.1 DUF2750 domain-containing protein [Listeria swaminathanii]MDT0054008.1 DUF2750 domain-containing protein [Listeria swaminathanii]